MLLPLLALALKATSLSWAAYWTIISSPRALSSYRVTLTGALIATVWNAIYGLLMAWVLVRYAFSGRRLLDALMDLPMALPTAVAGIALTTLFAPKGWFGHLLSPLGIKVAYTQLGIGIAMAFTSAPFVVRTVQPVLEEIEPEIEEAARTLGAGSLTILWRILWPAIFPAFLAGCALSFARSLGEFGAVIFIAGNLPLKTEITALLTLIRLEEFDYPAATAIASVLLIAAFLMLALTNAVQLYSLRHGEHSR
ncbi:sulfate transport system permease protein [Arboricoccus pini]|uniref:Sulfate transport system permease protein CysT n=1 Tax=Arboricoccus pini TaxID=1963835 RepID=A0A212QYL1_9PROT|nr:sulfate transport system permease protein [Arboricoccus pini]